MKADNESAIGLPVYFEHVKKWTIFFFFCEKTKKKGKKNPTARFEPRNFLLHGRSTRFLGYCATITNVEVCRQINQLWHLCPWNSAGRRCLKPVEFYFWSIERYIRGKQAWFWQLKPYFNSFRRIWRTYGQQKVSRKTFAKSLAACDSRRSHEVNQLPFSNSKHFCFYWTKKHCISEWYFTKNHEILGSLIVERIVRLTAESRAWSKSNCWSFRRVHRMDESKSFKSS